MLFPKIDGLDIPHSAIVELETPDGWRETHPPDNTALSANRLLTVGVSTLRSSLWPLALSFSQLGGLSRDQSLILGHLQS
jgi:hypothetical protein